MNRVLLIGSHHFTASIIAQVRGLEALAVMTAMSVESASHCMAEATPEVVIVQASQLIEGSVFKTFQQELHNAYFLVLEEPSRFLQSPSIHSKKSANNPQVTSEQNPIVLSAQLTDGFSELYIKKKIIALESGADAYMWLMPSEGAARDTANLSLESDSQINPIHQIDDLPVEPEQTNLPKQPSEAVLQASPPIVFRHSQRRLIQAHVQIGISRAQRYRDLSRINDWLSAVALVDALTQISNRRAFDLDLPSQIKSARDKGAQLSLMVIDIDFFKSINDRYGHLVGDDVLKLLAKRLLTNMRFYDRPFRYGGEEFVVTLSDTELTEAKIIAQRLCHSISQEPFELTHLVGEVRQIDITISIGLTELHPSDDDQGRSFLHRADQNLLQAKATGRNRVISI